MSGPDPKALRDLAQTVYILEPIHGFTVGSVPCNGCTRCCHGDALRMLPGDNVAEYETVQHDFMPDELMLAHKSNGDCIYLGATGCTIHERRPLMCREMDCRLIAKNFTYTQARKTRGLPMPVWERGREMLKGLRSTKPEKGEDER